MVKYLWIGKCLDEQYKQEVLSKGGYTSPSVSQDNLFNGLEKAANTTFDSINAIRVKPYPLYADKIIKDYRWHHKDNAYDVSVGYNNSKFFAHISKQKHLIKEAKKWIKQLNFKKDDQLYIYIYTMHSPFMATAKYIKQKLKNVKICVFVTDLPQYMDLRMSFVKKTLKALDWIKIKSLMKYVDKYILYSSYMADFLKLKDNWIAVEGLLDKSMVINDKPVRDKEQVTIMYSGRCDLNYGLKELIQAFESIDDENYSLVITGDGNANEYIKEYAKIDKRIKFLGFLKDRVEVLRLQKEATMLMNMRLPGEIASRYCFPSKVLEYMISGNPVLTFRIDGIPEEYYKYLTIMPTTSVDDIKNTILSVAKLTQEERDKIGEKAKQFILENKNIIVQTEKILKFCEE